MAQRHKVTSVKLAEILTAQAGRFLGQDASFIAPHLNIKKRRDGEPNWDVKLDFFGGVVITEVFNEAREYARARYELE
jgi:hypothetical protein